MPMIGPTQEAKAAVAGPYWPCEPSREGRGCRGNELNDMVLGDRKRCSPRELQAENSPLVQRPQLREIAPPLTEALTCSQQSSARGGQAAESDTAAAAPGKKRYTYHCVSVLIMWVNLETLLVCFNVGQ